MKKRVLLYLVILILLVGLVSGARELNCASDDCTSLVGYWKLNGDANDSSDNSND